jgi:NDP-sugar pyrophosphorylase family protein
VRVQCVILAGGLATRMRPLTDTIPKALLDVEGRPFVDYQLEWLAGHGVTDVVLSIGYRGEMLRAHVGDGTRFGVRVSYVDEGENLRGTAGALKLADERGVLEEAFLVTYGDSFLPIDFAGVFRDFLGSGKPALMTVFKNDSRWDKSNVMFDGRMVTLYDKHYRVRSASDFDYIDYGLSALARRVVTDEVPAPTEAGSKSDLADLFFALSRRGDLAGYEARERFYEIGSPEGLRDFGAWIRARR